MEKLTTIQVAKLLGISIDALNKLEKQGILHPIRSEQGVRFYSQDEIEGIKSRSSPTIAEEAAQANIGIQRELVTKVALSTKALLFMGGVFSGYVLLVILVTILFIISPLQTATVLGYIQASSDNLQTSKVKQANNVLGISTNSNTPKPVSLIRIITQPISDASLNIVKFVSPQAYAEVSKVTILDPNNIFTIDQNQSIIPKFPIKIPNNQDLQVSNSTQIDNLNSQFLQGKQPGTNVGDIAIVGDATAPQTVIVNQLAPISATTGLTNANLSGSAGISNSNLANSAVTINTTSPLSGGGSVGLGGNITLTCTSCGGSSSTFTASSTDSLTNKSLSGLTNTIINISNSALTNSSLTISAGSGLTDGGLVSLGGIITLSMPNTGTAGTYGSALNIPVFVTDAQGRVTNVTNTAISGLTNSNLSGAAGITNVNLANSSFSLAGNSGSGSIALGGTLTLTGAGITNIVSSGSTFTLTSTEADTLQSVFNRGNTIPTTTGSPANTIDQATLNIGNIASTAQNNFATLNIQNGGTGYLDVELIRGFINFQGMNTLYDDFTSRTLDTANRWNTTPVGTGSNCSILAGGLGGLFRIHSGGGVNRGCELTTQAITTLIDGYYQRGNNPIFETKVKIDIATNARIFVGFTEERVAAIDEINPNTNHAYIVKRAADTTWQCVTDDGGATETTTDTGVTIVANTFYRLRVELRNGTTPETICTVDDGTTVTRTVVTATQPEATSPMDVYVKLNQSDSIQKNMDVDYVRAWQDDPPVMALSPEGNIMTEAVNGAADAQTSNPPSATLLPNDDVIATDSGEVNPITEAINKLFKDLVEFLGKVIFHDDVTFLGRPTFNKDTAGHVIIKKDESEVEIKFAKEYINTPVVTASINLVGNIKSEDLPKYAIYDLDTHGFKIKLSSSTASDLEFSWIALAVNDDEVLITPTLIPSLSPTIIPTPTDIPVASESAQSSP